MAGQSFRGIVAATRRYGGKIVTPVHTKKKLEGERNTEQELGHTWGGSLLEQPGKIVQTRKFFGF